MTTIALKNVSTGQNGYVGNQAVTVFPDNAIAITKSDTDDYSAPLMVFAGGGGDVAVVPWDRRVESSPTPVVFAVAAGGCVPCRVWKVLSTGTTATGLVGVY